MIIMHYFIEHFADCILHVIEFVDGYMDQVDWNNIELHDLNNDWMLIDSPEV